MSNGKARARASEHSHRLHHSIRCPYTTRNARLSAPAFRHGDESPLALARPRHVPADGRFLAYQAE
jgi:hypothetical protein